MVTQRQIAESVAGLRAVARDLHGAADGEPVPETKGKIVSASVSGLRAHADFLERVVRELLELVDDEEPITLPRGESPAQSTPGPLSG